MGPTRSQTGTPEPLGTRSDETGTRSSRLGAERSQVQILPPRYVVTQVPLGRLLTHQATVLTLVVEVLQARGPRCASTVVDQAGDALARW